MYDCICEQGRFEILENSKNLVIISAIQYRIECSSSVSKQRYETKEKKF
jgi:hypothetical protein